MPKGKLDVIDITTPMAAAEVEETVHGDETEEHLYYNFISGPHEEELVHLEAGGVYQEVDQDLGVNDNEDEYQESDRSMPREMGRSLQLEPYDRSLSLSRCISSKWN